MIQFTGFAPDLDPTAPGVITDCTNLVPTLRGYVGAPSGVNVGMDALAAAALTGAVMTQLDGANRTFVGCATKLYEKSSATWADVSRATAYNASTSYPWRFAQFGNVSLAVNKGDVIQSSSSGAFADLTAPKAAVMCVASNFVMIANTNEATYGDSVDRWWCSEYLVHTGWTPAISTQCTTGRLIATPGAITGMRTLGNDVVAFKDRSMYLGRYVGAPGVWDFALIPGEVGCSSQEAIADIGVALVFIGFEDIYLFDGSSPKSVGTPLREWFFADLDPAYRYRIRSSHDRQNSLVYFYYPRTGNGGGLNGCIVYNYKADRWGVAHRSIEATVEYVTGGYTWNTLPITTWDSWPAVQWDSQFWTASTKYVAYIGTDHKVYSLTGASSSATMTTGDYGMEDNYSLLSRVTLRYLNAPTSATMTNYYQEQHGGAWTEDVTTTESSGRFDVLRSSVWHRVKFTFTGDFEISGAAAATTEPDGVF
jgi:hypothetical protein